MSKGRKSIEVFVVSEANSAELKGRQSVRTTFKLSPRAIDALSLLARQLGIKQKSIFDHLVDDARALQALAQEYEGGGMPHQDRVAKTYVISRRTLDSLDQASKRYQTPRDALVESSIERILPLLREEKRKHELRKKLRGAVSQYAEEGRRLFEQAAALLDADDPALENLYQMVQSVQAGHEAVEAIIEKGRKLENF